MGRNYRRYDRRDHSRREESRPAPKSKKWQKKWQKKEQREDVHGRGMTPAPQASPAAPVTSCVCRFEPRNAGQRQAVDLFPGVDILALVGPAGTGKTIAAVALAARHILDGHADRVILLRPAVEAAEAKLGFLKGGLDEKLAPHMQVFHKTLDKVARGFSQKKVEEAALGYLRGETFERVVVIADEVQNFTFAELRLLTTRLGEGGKLFLLGDPEQIDVGGSGLGEWLRRMDGAPGVGVVTFTDADILRHPRMREWVRRLR